MQLFFQLLDFAAMNKPHHACSNKHYEYYSGKNSITGVYLNCFYSELNFANFLSEAIKKHTVNVVLKLRNKLNTGSEFFLENLVRNSCLSYS